MARLAAVTGSVGKTSVTQAILAGLNLAGGGHGPVRSFNNHIGVPLTLARMPGQTRRAVFELGMNHAGEIAPLSRLVRPHVAVVTTVAAVHVEAFDDGEAGVARAKAEIFTGLERGGVAVLNAENRWFDVLNAQAEAAGAEVRAFGSAPGVAGRLIHFTPTPSGAFVEAEIDGRARRYPLRQSASHWGPMSLAALLTLRALDVDLEIALAALASFEPLTGRGAASQIRLPTGEATLIDDSYNASPVSVAAALRALGAKSPAGRRLVALTDMLELGPEGPAQHAKLADVADAADIDLMFCAGPLMRHAYEALPPSRRGAWTESVESLTPILIAALSPGDVILVKGSKASRAADIVAGLAKAFAPVLEGEES